MITYLTPRCRECGCIVYADCGHRNSETGEYVCDGCYVPDTEEDE